MDDLLSNVDGARERLMAWQERATRLAEDTQAASERLQQLRVSATDDNGIVELAVDSSGALIDVRLSSRIQRQAPEYTCEAILGAYRNARTELAEAAAEVVGDTLGTGSATGTAMLAGFAVPSQDGEEPGNV